MNEAVASHCSAIYYRSLTYYSFPPRHAKKKKKSGKEFFSIVSLASLKGIYEQVLFIYIAI